MAYYNTINLVSGDDKPELNFILRDSNTAAIGKNLDEGDSTTWAPIDLSNKLVVVHFRLLGSTSILDTLECTNPTPQWDDVDNIPTEFTGKCIMPWHPTTLDVPAGTYEGEIEIHGPATDLHPEGTRQTIFDKLKFKVRAGF